MNQVMDAYLTGEYHKENGLTCIPNGDIPSRM